jgi:cell division protein FtsZ
MLPYPRDESQQAPVPARVIGLGNAGVHLADRIAMSAPRGAEIIAMNSDAQSLTASVVSRKAALGHRATRGLGAGGDPEVGFEAARESMEEIRFAVEGAAVVVLVVGLGGGTGSGAAAVVAEAAREAGAYILVLATMPFSFEGRRRAAQAADAEAALAQHAHAILRFENDRMAELSAPRGGIGETFAASDALITSCVGAFLEMLAGRGPMPITLPGLLAAFAHGSPSAYFGRGQSDSENRAHEALEAALRSPLLDRGRMLGDCVSVIAHVSGPPSLSFSETAAIMRELSKHVPDDAHMFLGVSTTNDASAPVGVTIMGVESTSPPPPARRPRPQFETVPEPRPEPRPEPARRPRPAAPPPDEPTPPPAARHHPPPPADDPPLTPEPPGRLFADDEEAPPHTAPMPAVNPPPSAKPAREKKAASPKARQETLQFEPVARGRFEKSEPTIVGGEDLDVPTFLRTKGKP